MPSASSILLIASTAPSGSTAAVHLKSAKERAVSLGLNLGSEIESTSSLNSTSLATSEQRGIATLDVQRSASIIRTSQLEANIVT